jgi:hypothetical protein
VYCEHSFVTWRLPLRGEAADTAASDEASTSTATNTRNRSFVILSSYVVAGEHLQEERVCSWRLMRT